MGEEDVGKPIIAHQPISFQLRARQFQSILFLVADELFWLHMATALAYAGAIFMIIAFTYLTRRWWALGHAIGPLYLTVVFLRYAWLRYFGMPEDALRVYITAGNLLMALTFFLILWEHIARVSRLKKLVHGK